MLTGFQMATIAGRDENGTLYCQGCAADEYTRAVSRYELDEEQTALAEGYFEEDENHVEGCSCAHAVSCEVCGTELVEEYEDSDCVDKREAADA